MYAITLSAAKVVDAGDDYAISITQQADDGTRIRVIEVVKVVVEVAGVHSYGRHSS